MLRPSAALAGAAISFGLLLLVAAAAPHLPYGAPLADEPAGDPRYAPLVGLGLLLLLAGSLLLAMARRAAGMDPVRVRTVGVVGALVPPVAIGLLVAARSWSTLSGPARTPEMDRLLLVGAAGALVLAPACMLGLLSRLRPGRELRPRAAWEAVGLGGVLVAFAAVVTLGIAQSAPFSWDEAVYALTTRHWVQGTPDTGWGIHRPPVLSALGVMPLAFGTSEALFRVIGLVFGLAAVAAAWYLGRTLAGPVAGLLAAAVVAAAPTIQIDAGLFLNDVPSMAVLLVLLALTWRILERPGPVGWEVLWLAPIAAGAFYLRYGSVLTLVAIGLAALVLWPGRLASSWPRLLAAAGLLVVLLVPHGLFALAQTGSPFGIWLRAQSGAAGAYPGAGLVQYLAWLPSQLFGLLPAGVAVIGLLGGAYRLAAAGLRREWDPGSRAACLLLLPALIQIAVLGVFQLPQGRYIFLPMVLLVVAGAIVLADAFRVPGAAGRVAMAVVGAVVTVALVATAVDMPRRADERAAVYEWLRAAGGWIRSAGDGSCSILASDVPQLTWYSGCATYGFADTSRAGRERLLTGEHRYLVVRRDGRFQPDGEVMDAYLARVDPDPVARFENRNGVVVGTVYRFAASGPG